MEHTHEFDTSQAHERARFARMRKQFVADLKKVNKQEHLGLTRPEMEFLIQIASRSNIHLPWTWVQTGTQEEWAQDWVMGTSTLKRVLKGLREKEVLLGETAAVEKGLRGKRHREQVYPVWTINPVLMEIVCMNWCATNWAVDPKRELVRFAEHFRWTFRSETYDPIWHSAVSLTCGTYVPYRRRTPTPGQTSQNPVPPRDVDEYQEGKGNPPVYRIEVVDRTEKGSTVGGRLRRRSRFPLTTLDTREKVTHMSPVLGEDPDKPEPEPRKQTPASEIADHFATEWNAVAGTKSTLPVTPWADGSKVAFMAWVKKTFLPDHDNDIDLCKAMVTEFCKQPPSYHAASQRAPWRRFAGQQTKMRRKAAQAGYLSSAEQAAREEEQARHARAKAQRRKQMKQMKENRNDHPNTTKARTLRPEESIFYEPDDD